MGSSPPNRLMCAGLKCALAHFRRGGSREFSNRLSAIYRPLHTKTTPDRQLCAVQRAAGLTGQGADACIAAPPKRGARWRSGHAEDCKSLHAGSIPARASKLSLTVIVVSGGGARQIA